MTTPNPSPPAAGAARRKLLRGAFALPAVAAVHSGAAVAASNLRCLANGPTAASAPPVIAFGVSETPQYLRVELAVSQKGGGAGAQYRYHVSGVKLYAEATLRGVAVNPSLIGSTSFREFDTALNSITGASQTEAQVNSGGWSLLASPANSLRRFAVLMFDSSGTTIVGVGKTTVGTGGANAATESCWTSFSV